MNGEFRAVADTLFDPGMGTENAATLLYAVAAMRRPSRVLAVGLGYSTLFLLQALADNHAAARRDAAIVAGHVDAPARRDVLDETQPVDTEPPRLIGIDDFSADPARLTHFLRCVERLQLSSYLELQRCRYQDLDPATLPALQFAWIDCGHQLDYSDLINRYWPLLDADGGVLALHYTYVDVLLRAVDGDERLLIPGPCLNALGNQQRRTGRDGAFELLTLVEPHKLRQGSVTLLRKLAPVDRCRAASLEREQHDLYGSPGTALLDLGADPAQVVQPETPRGPEATPPIARA